MRNPVYVKFFEEFGIEDVPIVGGKNASLGEMYQKLSGQGGVDTKRLTPPPPRHTATPSRRPEPSRHSTRHWTTLFQVTLPTSPVGPRELVKSSTGLDCPTIWPLKFLLAISVSRTSMAKT